MSESSRMLAALDLTALDWLRPTRLTLLHSRPFRHSGGQLVHWMRLQFIAEIGISHEWVSTDETVGSP